MSTLPAHIAHTGDDDTIVIGYMTVANRQFFAIDQSRHDKHNPFMVYGLEPDGRRVGEYMTSLRSDAFSSLYDRVRRWCDAR